MARVLLVDDEANILMVLSCMLKSKKHDVVSTTEGQKAIDLVKAETFDLLISDIRMNPVDGMTVLRAARAAKPDMPVLMLTAYGSQETAQEAVGLGAFGYLLKPFNLQELLLTVQRAITYKSRLKLKDDKAEVAAPAPGYDLEDIVAESQSMKDVCSAIRKAAANNDAVLICGKRWTGKSLVARAIHALSPRKSGPVVTVNCAALPEPLLDVEMFGCVKGAFPSATANRKGSIESANGGMIVFDEIGWMPQTLQSKLKRTAVDKGIWRLGGHENLPVDVRIVGTSITPAGRLVEEDNVLKDLYGVLSANVIELRELKERPEDIMPLFRFVLGREAPEKAKQVTISREVEDILHAYNWPGNVGELEFVAKESLTRAANFQITVASLPADVVKAVTG